MKITSVFLLTPSIALTLLLAGVARADETPAAKANIILIMADDLGWSDLECYGSDFHETPNLNWLSRNSVRFNRAYSASPVCTPTRASIMTGKHPARLNMTIWREAALDRGNHKLLEPICLDSLPVGETTIAEKLRARGYNTVHIGKWHLGRAESYPQAHGFRRNIGGTLWGAPQTFFYPYAGDHYFQSGWRYVPDLEPGNPGDYLTDRLTDKALKTLEEHDRSRPLFINLWFHSPHTPIEGKEELVSKYQAKLDRTKPKVHKNPHYAAMIESIDHNVGRILAALKKHHIEDETAVIFLSDNGGFINGSRLQNGQATTSNAPLRSGKGSCYEGGIRVPLMIRWPQLTNTPAEVEIPVYSCDLFNTLATMAGSAINPGEGVDGTSLLPLMLGQNLSPQRDALFFHYPHYYPTTSPVSALIEGHWKLLHFYESQSDELYNLDRDPSETTNVAAEYPDLARQMAKRLDSWISGTGAKKPELNPNKP